MPITAAPANPAPSSMTSSKCAAGTILTFGAPLMSTNCASRYSMPSSCIRRRTSSLLAIISDSSCFELLSDVA